MPLSLPSFSGPYQLTPAFSKRLIDDPTWYQMTKKEKASKKAQFCGKFPDYSPNSSKGDKCKIVFLWLKFLHSEYVYCILLYFFVFCLTSDVLIW